MSTFDTIRSSLRSAKVTLERAVPELGYNDLVAVFDEAEQLFQVLSNALHARRIPDPIPPQNMGTEPPPADPTDPAPEIQVTDTADEPETPPPADETPPPAAA